MLNKTSLLMVLVVLLAACKHVAQPSEEMNRIGMTPNLQPYWTKVVGCQQALNQRSKVDALPLSALMDQEYEFILRVGATHSTGALITQTGRSQIRFILNPANPLSSLENEQVISVLLGMATDWRDLSPDQFPSSTPIHLLSYNHDDDVRMELEDQLLNSHPISYAISLVPDATAMLQAVAQDPTAFGYVLDLQSLDGVKVLQVPSGTAGFLDVPVLAIFPQSPNPENEAMIRCLQGS